MISVLKQNLYRRAGLSRTPAYFFCTWQDTQTDRQTDGQTLHNGISCACIASHGKNHLLLTKLGICHIMWRTVTSLQVILLLWVCRP